MNIREYIKNFKNIYFDCDGVILQSNQIKTDGFKKLFINYSKENINKILNYHISNGGISRFEKIKFFHENILNQEISKNKIIKLSKMYGDIIELDLLKAKFVPGFIFFLKYLYKLDMNIFVISGSEENQLKRILKKKNISQYFKEIKGSPKNKSENLKEIFTNNSYRSNCLFFGDSYYDFKISNEFNLDYIHVLDYSEFSLHSITSKKLKLKLISNFTHRSSNLLKY